MTSIGLTILRGGPRLRRGVMGTSRLTQLGIRHRKTVHIKATRRLTALQQVFTVVKVCPIDCCSLSRTKIPMRSATFQPVSSTSLTHGPFHIFASLLHLRLVRGRVLHRGTTRVLHRHSVFAPHYQRLLRRCRRRNNFGRARTRRFIRRTLRAFH